MNFSHVSNSLIIKEINIEIQKVIKRNAFDDLLRCI